MQPLKWSLEMILGNLGNAYDIMLNKQATKRQHGTHTTMKTM